MTHDTNNYQELNEENKIEEAKSTAMSKERKAITDLFKGINFEVEDIYNKNPKEK